VDDHTTSTTIYHLVGGFTLFVFNHTGTDDDPPLKYCISNFAQQLVCRFFGCRINGSCPE
jgi:hypothetical protein